MDKPVLPGDDPYRGTGRTTRLMVKAISDALQAGGEWVDFIDHCYTCRETARDFRDQIKGMCTSLDLKVRLRLAGNVVQIKCGISGK
jgi:hypothetical protein